MQKTLHSYLPISCICSCRLQQWIKYKDFLIYLLKIYIALPYSFHILKLSILQTWFLYHQIFRI